MTDESLDMELLERVFGPGFRETPEGAKAFDSIVEQIDRGSAPPTTHKEVELMLEKAQKRSRNKW